MRDYTAKEYFNRMRRNPGLSNAQQEQEAREWAAFKAIRNHPIGPERSAAVQGWLATCREGRRRENIGRERERQLMRVHDTADRVSRADYWEAKRKAQARPPMSYFAKPRTAAKDYDRER